MKHTSLRRLGAVAVSVALAVGATITGASPAQAGAPQDQATRWLAKQLTDGVVHNDDFGFDDYGLTADVGFALAAIGDHEATVKDIRHALAKHVQSWTTGADFGTSDVYAGPTAKAVVFAEVAGKNPDSFGGVDLIKQLSRRVSNEEPIVGRIEDKSTSGDFANTIGQALAAQGLAFADSRKADEVIAFLLKQQCHEGWFRLNFTENKSKKNQTCDGGNPKTSSVPDTDATALALLSLLALPHHSRAVNRAIDNATDWLVGHQERNGSFGGGPATEAPNTNSTGLAAWALGSAGACRVAQDAADWVYGLQLTSVKRENGAIAYDKAAYQAANAADGIDESSRDQYRRATAQAAPALVYVASDTCS
jgi:hypothetical protein